MRSKTFLAPFSHIVEILNQNSKQKTLAGFILSISILSAQNLIIFFNHYFRDYGFPWDFPMGYYPIVAYWTSLTSQGYIPTWIPFQQMGYPMALLMQSGLHYPAFWIFPVLKIPYTLNAAVVFQSLHILFGTIGMFLFLRLVLKSNSYALLGAFAFQFFGGFYSNAEHADIVRSFAFAPWLLYSFSINHAHLKISWRYFLIPLLILFLATGGYPGNFVSSIFIMGVFVILQILHLIYRKEDWKKIFKLSIFILAMTILGVGMSFYHLGPGWLYRNYMIRSDIIVSYFSMGLEYLPGLFLNNNVFSTEISMTSTFITMPMLFLIAYLPGKAIKQWWPMMVLGIFSLLMIAGPDSMVWFVLTKFIPPLRLSRFPSSDYRVFIAIPIIIFAIFGAKALIERKINRKSFIIRTFLIALMITQGIYYSYLPMHETMGWLKTGPFVQATAALGLTSLILIIYFFIPHRSYVHLYVGVVMIIALMAIDAVRVLPNMITWQVPDFSSFYSINNWPLQENDELITYQLLGKSPQQRPARIKKVNTDYGWEGYITGRYLYNDLVPFVLKSPYIVEASPVYRDYMEKAWTPLLFDSEFVLGNNLSIPDTDFSNKLNEVSNEPDDNFVKQTRYGINEIFYEVTLDKPQIFIENEIFFPGWKAYLDYGDVITEIKAFSTNEVFRTWALPPGKYHMLATFEFPYTPIYNGISFGAFIIWTLGVILKRKARAEI